MICFGRKKWTIISVILLVIILIDNANKNMQLIKSFLLLNTTFFFIYDKF